MVPPRNKFGPPPVLLAPFNAPTGPQAQRKKQAHNDLRDALDVSNQGARKASQRNHQLSEQKKQQDKQVKPGFQSYKPPNGKHKSASAASRASLPGNPGGSTRGGGKFAGLRSDPVAMNDAMDQILDPDGKKSRPRKGKVEEKKLIRRKDKFDGDAMIIQSGNPFLEKVDHVAKQSQQAVSAPRPRKVCDHWMNGWCKYGNKCWHLHPPKPEQEQEPDQEMPDVPTANHFGFASHGQQVGNFGQPSKSLTSSSQGTKSHPAAYDLGPKGNKPFQKMIDKVKKSRRTIDGPDHSEGFRSEEGKPSQESLDLNDETSMGHEDYSTVDHDVESEEDSSMDDDDDDDDDGLVDDSSGNDNASITNPSHSVPASGPSTAPQHRAPAQDKLPFEEGIPTSRDSEDSDDLLATEVKSGITLPAAFGALMAQLQNGGPRMLHLLYDTEHNTFKLVSADDAAITQNATAQLVLHYKIDNAESFDASPTGVYASILTSPSAAATSSRPMAQDVADSGMPSEEASDNADTDLQAPTQVVVEGPQENSVSRPVSPTSSTSSLKKRSLDQPAQYPLEAKKQKVADPNVQALYKQVNRRAADERVQEANSPEATIVDATPAPPQVLKSEVTALPANTIMESEATVEDAPVPSLDQQMQTPAREDPESSLAPAPLPPAFTFSAPPSAQGPIYHYEETPYLLSMAANADENLLRPLTPESRKRTHATMELEILSSTSNNIPTMMSVENLDHPEKRQRRDDFDISASELPVASKHDDHGDVLITIHNTQDSEVTEIEHSNLDVEMNAAASDQSIGGHTGSDIDFGSDLANRYYARRKKEEEDRKARMREIAEELLKESAARRVASPAQQSMYVRGADGFMTRATFEEEKLIKAGLLNPLPRHPVPAPYSNLNLYMRAYHAQQSRLARSTTAAADRGLRSLLRSSASFSGVHKQLAKGTAALKRRLL